MCGIVGYIGKKQAGPVLLSGLSKLEYRGYDSAGIAVRADDGTIAVERAKGKLQILVDKTEGGTTLPGTCGIGHTRWATHGEANEINAHPHKSTNEKVVVVHNGIIENYRDLKSKLIKEGYTFYSETDTEVIGNLIEYYCNKYKKGVLDAIGRLMNRVRGSYAIAVMHKDYPDEIYAARKDSPMIIGVKDDETLIASDVAATLQYTREVYYIGNLEIARLTRGKAEFFDIDRNPIEKELTTVTWDAKAAEKEGFEHFMIKEIFEQPAAIANTIHSVLRKDKLDFSEIKLSDGEIRGISNVWIVACGSAYHAGVATQYVMEKLARVPVRVELASEFRYRNPILGKKDLVIIISQSGETADSLAALREAKARGVKTLAIVNVIGSSIAREADAVFYTMAGPEIAVATTKAYSAQLIAGYLIAVKFALARKTIHKEEALGLISEINEIPDKVKEILKEQERLQRFAADNVNAEDVFFIGRGIDYAISLEGSLKLKEISYIHSEAYAAGELKHGTISLIEEGTLVIGLLTQGELCEKTVSNMIEVKSRGARLVGVSFKNSRAKGVADFEITLPPINDLFAASLAVVPLQLISYYVSVSKGLDVDKPRNLAKSVTVE